jgi:hypothetical protein
VHGVKGDAKHKKRESEAKLKTRHYHVQENQNVVAPGLKMKAVGLPAGKHNGIMACYNLRTDSDLGAGLAAVRRIPCACAGCLAELAKPWQPGVPPEEQDRYLSSLTCSMSPIFEGLNNWQIVQLVKTKDTTCEDMEDAQRLVLDGVATRFSESVREDGFGAFITDDPDSDGYYVVQWMGDPYTLQEDTELTEYNPMTTMTPRSRSIV